MIAFLQLQVLLLKEKKGSFKGGWSFPIIKEVIEFFLSTGSSKFKPATYAISPEPASRRESA
jgi:hypothetical protein